MDAIRRLRAEGLSLDECRRLVAAWLRGMIQVAAGDELAVDVLVEARAWLAAERERADFGVCWWYLGWPPHVRRALLGAYRRGELLQYLRVWVRVAGLRTVAGLRRR